MKQHAIILGILALAFFCRVIGQLWVVLDSPEFLPPAEEWQSGLIPYSLLLPAQVCILIFQLVVFLQLWMQSGPLTTPRPSLGRFLKFSSLVYFLAMIVRYALTMYLYPDMRWLGDIIPISFHCVLALYIYALSLHFRRIIIKT